MENITTESETEKTESAVVLYSPYHAVEPHGDGSNYVFVERTETGFSFHCKTLRKSNQSHANKWSKFLSSYRLTVNIKHPTYLGFPTVNVYLYATSVKNGRKKIINVTNDVNISVVSKMTNQEYDWFINELESLLERNNLAPTMNEVYQTLNRVATQRNKKYSFFGSKLDAKVRYVELLLHPGITHFRVEKPVDDIKLWVKMPASKVRTFEHFCRFFKLNHAPLINWLKERWDENRISPNTVLLLSICSSYKQSDLLEVLKVEEICDEHLLKENLFELTDITNHLSELKGLMLKFPPEQLMNLMIETTEKLIKARGSNSKWESGIIFPNETALTLWSKNYRAIKPVKETLKTLSTQEVISYVETYVFKVEDTVTTNEYINRLNNLTLVTEPVEELTIPKPYDVLFEPQNNSGNNNISRRKQLMATSQFFKNNTFLTNFFKKYGTESKYGVTFPAKTWESVISALEDLDKHILKKFKRAKVPVDKNLVKIVFDTIIRLNSSSYFYWMKGDVPANLVKLLSYGMPVELAMTLIGNKVKFTEIYENLITDNRFCLPIEWVTSMYDFNQRFMLPEGSIFATSPANDLSDLF